MRTATASVLAFAFLGAFAPSFASGAASACSAWIGQPKIALSATERAFEITRDGRLRQLPAAPSVYRGAYSFFGGSRVMRAPHGGFTATLRGQRTTTRLSVARPGKDVVVDHGVQLGSVVWSPDGGVLAFSVRGARGRLASTRSGFHVIAIHATVCSPYAWSRDSLRVAFVASTTGDCAPAPSTLAVVDPSTGAIISSAPFSAGVWSGPPTWSADGAYVAHSHLLMPGIAIAPRSSTGNTSSSDDCTSRRWSPIGHRLATICAGVLTLIDAGTGHQTSLATSRSVVASPRAFWDLIAAPARPS